jgi:sulfite exporter TauE/SafE
VIALLVTGLLGSFHCVGMCGGFVLALDRPGRVPWRALGVQGLLLLGKACTYLLLGAIAGVAGAAVLRTPWFSAAQVGLSVLAGLLMVLAGLQLLGLLRGLPGGGLFGPGSLYERACRAVANARGAAAPFAMGALMGLLPCPLVYAFLAAALAAGTFLGAVGTMGLLALTSAPALLLVGFAGRRLRPAGGAGAVRAAGVVVVLVGVVTVARGAFPGLHHALHMP